MGVEPFYLYREPHVRAIQRRTYVAAGIVLALTLAGLLTTSLRLPQFGWLAWSLLVIQVLANLGGAALLYGTLQTYYRRSIQALAAALIGGALISLCTLLVVPPAPGVAAALPAARQSASWLFALWHIYWPLAVLGYAYLRRSEHDDRPSLPRDLNAYAATIGIVVGGGCALALFGSQLLPTLLLAGDQMIGYRNDGPGLASLLLAAFATAYALRIPRAQRMDRAVALTAFAVGLGTLVSLFGMPRFTLAYYLLRTINCAAMLYIASAALGRILAASRRVREAATIITRTQRLASRQSERLAAIWRLVRDDAMNEPERLQALLDAAAGSLRPGRPFFGAISSRDGDDIIVEFTANAAPRPDGPGARAGLFDPGKRVPLHETLLELVDSAGSTISFSDLNHLDHLERRRYSASAIFDSYIGTTFAVGNVRYYLTFGSQNAVRDDPFSDDDHAFIDVLASFLAAQIHRGRQFAQLRYQIEHDVLTGLPNRSTFRAAAQTNLAGGVPFAIVIVDLDRFRTINETFGHMVGDALLVEIAAGLRKARQSGDVIARLAGDNFAILIDDVRGTDDVELRLQGYRETFKRPFSVGDRDGKEALRVGASFGVALAPQDGTTFEQLLARADAAVDAAKQRSRGSIAFFNEQLERTIERGRTLHTELARAITHNEFEVWYQPTVDLRGEHLIGSEALIRWRHPERGLVYPDEFIPFAEKNGLIAQIGECVMEKVIDDLSSMPDLPPAYKCYINLSGQQFGDLNFVAALRRRLERSPGITGHLGIEITETVAMSDVDRTLDSLARLRELGCSIALDDFGTGYSSLSYLKRFPIDVLKIDRSFVSGLPSDPHDEAVVETVLTIAQRFNFLTLAEGIEDAAQFAWLRERGCLYGQGYLIARPMPFPQLVPWLTAGSGFSLVS